MKVNLHEAKTHLSRLVQRAVQGEEIIIAKAGKALVKLVPVEQPAARRHFGQDEGKIWIADDFDDPLPEDIQKYFEGRGD